MGRVCASLLATFRVIQFLCSLVAVGCGIFITYEMKSMSTSAHDLELSIQKLQDDPTERATLVYIFNLSDGDVKSAIDTLSAVLDPVLHVLQGPPVRAIIISVAAIWSLLIITYLFFTQRSKSHNKRSSLILLELITLLFWIAGITSSILLALEYSFITFAGGAEAEASITVTRQLLSQVLKEFVQTAVTDASSKIADTLDIVGGIVTVGAVAIASVVVSGVCFHISVVSLIVAFCVTGSTSTKDDGYGDSAEGTGPSATSMLAGYEKKSTTSHVT